MKKIKTIFIFLMTLSSSLLLSACGGDDDNKDKKKTIAEKEITQPSLTLRDDPFYKYQWHLKNVGQNTLASTLPLPGIDLNIGNLHEQGFRGTGVIVGVVDEGVELNHEDLIDNVIQGGSYNFETKTSKPDIEPHGTSVAGILLASGWNGKGGRGVAPEAKFKSFDIFEIKKDSRLVNPLDSLNKLSIAKDVQIFNMSYGIDANVYSPFSTQEINVQETMMRNTRGGLGGIYIKGSGNTFINSSVDKTEEGCTGAQTVKLGCVSANIDPVNSLHEIITVGAIDATGIKTSYSSVGSSLWVVAPGGENGYHELFFKDTLWQVENFSYLPAIFTTDVMGCKAGYNKDSERAINEIDRRGQSTLDPSCNYTAGFNGTSAATPMVSGVAALMLQANPNLTQRDVKYILATTARKVDANKADNIYKGITIESAWTTNAAGRAFSNWYGFGLVDASAAVKAAQSFVSLGPLKDSDWIKYVGEAQSIDGQRGAQALIRVSKNIKIETVQLNFQTTHTKPTNLLVTLTSPSRTKSYVLTPFALMDKTPGGFQTSLIAANNFLDELSEGDWTLSIIEVEKNSDSDATTSSIENAKLISWNLRVLGH